MTILLYLVGLGFSVFGIWYVSGKKKKLSDENILEFEKVIKPSLLKFRLISAIPILCLCFYLLNGTTDFRISYFIYTALGSVLLTIVSYFGMKKVVQKSTSTLSFKFTLNYCILFGLTLLTLVFAAMYSLKDYLINY
jgi:hypothetical protein